MQAVDDAGEDEGTAGFYRRYAELLTRQPEARHSGMYALFQAHLWPGARVLDVGAGAGRDVAALLSLGIDAYGIEPSAAMRERALAQFPELQGRLAPGQLLRLGRPFAQAAPLGFDAVVCSAVLMHVPPAMLSAALLSMRDQLHGVSGAETSSRPGLLFVSLPEMDRARLQGERDEEGRRFHNHGHEPLVHVLEAQGFRLVEHRVNGTLKISTGTVWHSLVWTRGAASPLVP